MDAVCKLYILVVVVQIFVVVCKLHTDLVIWTRRTFLNLCYAGVDAVCKLYTNTNL